MNVALEAERDQFEAWLRHGIEKRWVTAPFCGTHESPEFRDDELAWFEKGEDPCVPLIRVWGTP